MAYAFLTDGLEPEAREQIDKALEGKQGAKPGRERDAVAAAMRFAR